MTNLIAGIAVGMLLLLCSAVAAMVFNRDEIAVALSLLALACWLLTIVAMAAHLWWDR